MAGAIEFLLAAQNLDGGWGYKRGGMSYVEPTAAVLLALDGQKGGEAERTRARAFLRGLQRADGGWGIAAVDGESGWMTGWAVWALAHADTASAARGAEWLLRTSGIRSTKPAEVERIRKILKIDATLMGWPWQVGDGAWIFPTALALLALDAMGYAQHPRVAEGMRFLADRAIPSGGWNVGNPFMLTGALPPTIGNTAFTLIALNVPLRDVPLAAENDVTAKARAFLVGALSKARTAAELAWGAWALRRIKLDVEHPGGVEHPGRAGDVAMRLRNLQRADGSWDGNPLTTAVALLAQVEHPGRVEHPGGAEA